LANESRFGKKVFAVWKGPFSFSKYHRHAVDRSVASSVEQTLHDDSAAGPQAAPPERDARDFENARALFSRHEAIAPAIVGRRRKSRRLSPVFHSTNALVAPTAPGRSIAASQRAALLRCVSQVIAVA
jgi:hypothetical protein